MENDIVHFILLRVETDKDLRTLYKAIQNAEKAVSPMTVIDPVQHKEVAVEAEEQFGGPVIYFP